MNTDSLAVLIYFFFSDAGGCRTLCRYTSLIFPVSSLYFSDRSIAILMAAAAAAAGGENYKENGKKNKRSPFFVSYIFNQIISVLHPPYFPTPPDVQEPPKNSNCIYYTPSAIIKIVDYFTNDYIYSLKASGYIIHVLFLFRITCIFFLIVYNKKSIRT